MNSIAFSIGNAALTWHKELLANVLNQKKDDEWTKSVKMEILAIAFWRSEKLIFTLKEHEYNTLCYSLYDCLKFDLCKVAREKKGYFALSKHLELLLALLRMRKSGNEACKTLLAPDKELTQQYVDLVDASGKLISKSGFVMRSRISLSLPVEKPEQFRNTPDILYALRMYLTGDTGADAIAISDIRDEGQ